jgi:high-affinity iron transporter
MGADGIVVGLSMKSIRFNVAWNIWREVAECGVFLIPFFLGEGAIAIPLSAVIGIILGLAIGLALYWGNRKLNNKKWLAFFMAAVLGMLSVGLFTGGCHEFEEVWGETPVSCFSVSLRSSLLFYERECMSYMSYLASCTALHPLLHFAFISTFGRLMVAPPIPSGRTRDSLLPS